MRPLVVFIAAACTAWAGEYAVLTNGERIHADSHQLDGDTVRLSANGGSIAIPASMVDKFEREEYVAPAPQPAAQPSAQAAHQTAPAAVNVPPQELIRRAAEKAGLPAEIVQSVAKAESAYRPDAISPKGAIGLMQLMPGTAAQLNANPYDPKQNAEAGARYLAELLEKYENDKNQVSKAIAAYNAGPAAVDKYHGVPPYRETVNYVRRVIADYNKRTSRKKSAAAASD